MAVKAPPPAPAPVYNWTGWYVGANVGASFGRAKTDFNAAPVTLLAGIPPSTPVFTIPGIAGSSVTEPSGVIGGGQIGYNWQFSPIWVVGLEADIQASGEKDSVTITNTLSAPVTGAAVTQYEAKIDWFGTVRARLGDVWGDGKVLTYVTGGLAYGRVAIDGTSTVNGFIGTPLSSFSVNRAIGHSQVNSGWTVGTGTEGRLLIPGWTYKIEYLYVDLGSLDDPDTGLQITGATGGQIHTHTHFSDNIIRLGVNYQFH
jgi:outer membrane immunogenic protein